MSAYVYDGTFAGLVCAVKEAAGDPAAVISAEPPAQENLFSPALSVAADPGVCAAYLRLLDEQAGPGAAEAAKLYWLARGADKERHLLAWARMAFSKGRALHGLHADAHAGPVLRSAAAVLREAHRFRGSLRFAELPDRTLLAAFEPEHDLLPLLAAHYRRRQAAFNWVLLDVRRGRAALHFSEKLRMAPAPPPAGEAGRAPGYWRGVFNAAVAREKAAGPRENLPDFDDLPPEKEQGRACGPGS